jgi:hypothetical protein
MATLRIAASGAALHPEFPIERERFPVEVSKRMVNGQLRVAHVAEKVRMRYGAGGLTEAQRATWAAAHPAGSSFVVVDELNVSRTVVRVSYVEQIERSAPDAGQEGLTSATGDTFYRIDVEVEQV